MSEKDNHSEGKKGDNVCRDFLRNVCRRGDRCKFSHDSAIVAKAKKPKRKGRGKRGHKSTPALVVDELDGLEYE